MPSEVAEFVNLNLVRSLYTSTNHKETPSNTVLGCIIARLSFFWGEEVGIKLSNYSIFTKISHQNYKFVTSHTQKKNDYH